MSYGNMGAMEHPFTKQQMQEAVDRGEWYMEGIIDVCLDDLMTNDYESNLDLLSTKLTGDDLLMDISYRIMGHGEDGMTLYLSVRGDVTCCIEN